MKIQVLSKRKKEHGLDHYTKHEMREIPSFLYDEDVLWLDIGKKRYGINLDIVKKMRKSIHKVKNIHKVSIKNEVAQVKLRLHKKIK